MYIDKYKNNQEEFKKILNFVLNKQPEILNLKDISFEDFNDTCWCRVTYTTPSEQTHHFWVNDFNAYSKDKSVNIGSLNRNYARQIYLHNIHNARQYIYNYEQAKNKEPPIFLHGYRTALTLSIKQNDPFFGIYPEDISKKLIFHKYISQNSLISEKEIFSFLQNNQILAAEIVKDLADEYKIPCTIKQASEKIEQIMLEVEQKYLNNEIQTILQNNAQHDKKSFEQAKQIIYLERQIDDYETNLRHLKYVYDSTSKLNNISLRTKIQNYSMENNQLMQNDFYRTILENILILEIIKKDTRDFASNIDFERYWAKQLKDTKTALTSTPNGANYAYDIYSLASMMANKFGLQSSKYRPIFYKELLTEQDKILNNTEHSPEQIEYNLELNYKILAEELKKSPTNSNERVKLFADTFTRYNKMTQPQINEQYQKEVAALQNQISILKAIKLDKLKACKKSTLDIKDILTRKSTIDKRLDKLQSFDGFYGIDELIKLDFENSDINAITNDVLSKKTIKKEQERSA